MSLSARQYCRFRCLAAIVFPLLLLPRTAQADVTVYVGYAENERTPIFFPNPWLGSPKTHFLGYSGPAWDTGAILIRNNGPGDVTLGPGAYVDGFTDGAKFQLWDSYIGSGLIFHPGENVILAQTAAGNFDTSDHPIQLTPNLAKPVIHLTLNSVARNFVDSAQVLNTGGFDLGNALGRNESLQWRPVGTTGILFPGGTGIPKTAIVTHHNDNARTGQYPTETSLAPGNVNSATFGRLFSYPVDGQIYAQPLAVQRLKMADGAFHNIVFVATEHDSVYAFDADDDSSGNGGLFWRTSLVPDGATSCPSDDICSGNISPEFGVTGTPVINTATRTLYVVSKTKELNYNTNPFYPYVQRLHALDLVTGKEKFGGPIEIRAAVPGTGDGTVLEGNTWMVHFNPLYEAQRPALLLHQGIVYISWASHCDVPPYHGWVLGYDQKTLQLRTIFNTTPNGLTDPNAGQYIVAGAGIWMSGCGPAVSGDSIYFLTGNGVFNGDTGGSEFGDSMVKLAPAAGQIGVSDYFTPYNQQAMHDQDVDFGSGGVLALPLGVGSLAHKRLLVTAGKTGTIYLVDGENMGGFHAGFDAVVQSLPGAIGGAWSMPAYFKSTVYYHGVGDVLKAFSIKNGVLSSTPVAKSAIGYRYPGATPSISYDNTAKNTASRAVVWDLEKSGTGKAILHAYRSDNLAELYNSDMAGRRDTAGDYLHFTLPSIAFGKVYVGTWDRLSVFGNSFWTPSPLIGPASGTYPGSIDVTMSDSAPNATIKYTLDGSEPSPASLTYTGAFSLSKNAVVRARAYAPGFRPGDFAEAVYFIGAQTVYAVNSGGGGASPFTSDNFYNAGNTFTTSHAIDRSMVTNPAPAAVYQSERYGNFTYTFPNLTPGTSYKVRLHFAEIYWSASGKRVFNVAINGTTVLSNFDIFAASGGQYIAIVKEFSGTADANGNLKVSYQTVVDNAKSSGIEVIYSP